MKSRLGIDFEGIELQIVDELVAANYTVSSGMVFSKAKTKCQVTKVNSVDEALEYVRWLIDIASEGFIDAFDFKPPLGKTALTELGFMWEIAQGRWANPGEKVQIHRMQQLLTLKQNLILLRDRGVDWTKVEPSMMTPWFLGELGMEVCM